MEKLIEFLKELWGKRKSIPIAVVIAVIIWHKICSLQNISGGYLLELWMRWVVSILLFFLVVAYAVFCFVKQKFPVAPTGSLAVLFVIDAETEKQFESVKYKLVNEFRDLVQANVDCPNIVAQCIQKERVSKYNLLKKEDTIKLLQKTNCLFLVKVKYMVDDNENAENFEMRIDCGVAHPHFNETIERSLKRDLTNLGSSLKQQSFSKEKLLPIFRFTAQALSYTCQYIFGFVCLFCRNTNEALNIYENLKKKLMQEQPSNIVRLLQELVPIRLHTAYIDMAESNMMHFQRSKELAHLQLAQNALEEANKLVPSSYAYNLDMAYIAIALNQDYSTAKDCIENCKKFKDAANSENTWRYSDAFLRAYKGHSAPSIMGKYQAAFDTPYNGLLDLTDYIEYILEKEPDRIGLHLAVGLIYEHFGDNRLMKNHFQTYIAYLGDSNPRVVATLQEKMRAKPCEFDCGHECQNCSGLVIG